MKKFFLFSAFVCLLLANAVAAQEKAANFVGVWELDAAKSKLPERMRIESMTLNVAQTDKTLTVETQVKRAPRAENAGQASMDANGGMRRNGNRGTYQGSGEMGGGGRGMTGGGNGSVTYNLDGKEQMLETETRDDMPAASVKMQAKTESGGKLKLTTSRSFETQMGSMTVKMTETWELLDGGKTLKVVRDTETPRGTQSAEMYFTRKFVTSVRTISAPIAPAQTIIVSDAEARILTGDVATQNPKVIESGVLNGKALKLIQPSYPPAARAVRASGAVNVRVTVDEQGKVVAASAVSGHPLLRQAAENAARQAELAPTLLEGKAVKVTGIIVYNFVP